MGGLIQDRTMVTMYMCTCMCVEHDIVCSMDDGGGGGGGKGKLSAFFAFETLLFSYSSPLCRDFFST